MKWFNECYGVYLFGIYLLLNVLDWLTGWYKACLLYTSDAADE